MRGKKSSFVSSEDDFAKRAGFVGMRGKKSAEKRAGFVGMRGKKMVLFPLWSLGVDSGEAMVGGAGGSGEQLHGSPGLGFYYPKARRAGFVGMRG